MIFVYCMLILTLLIRHCTKKGVVHVKLYYEEVLFACYAQRFTEINSLSVDDHVLRIYLPVPMTPVESPLSSLLSLLLLDLAGGPINK